MINEITTFSNELAKLSSDEIFKKDTEIALADGVTREGNMPLFHKGNKHGVLLIHGFTASPHEMHVPANLLIEQGFTVYNARVKGHGVSLEHMQNVTYVDWYNSLQCGYHALKNSCDTITVMGQSNGGLLATAVALNNDVNSLGLLAPAYKVGSPAFPFIKYIKKIIKRFPRHLSEDEQLHNYNFFPTTPMHEMQKLQEYVIPKVENVTVPVYLGIAKVDTLVSTRFALKTVERMPSTDKTVNVYNNIEHSLLHILTSDFMTTPLNDTINWVKRVNNC